MKQFSKDLGNVSLAPKGKWSREQEYERLALVYNAYNNLSYVAKINVPIGVDIENREYWQPMNATGYADNNFINLTAENENGTITAYESIEEAIATIVPINRRAGATLSFYNLNSDRLDRQAEFELWQFNSTDLVNWENKDYWNNIYYNWNVFAGWYIGADALKNHVKIPNVGQYAYVGSNLNDAVLYQCRTNGTWTNTGTKVRNYISVVVSGNITIGENGNWFSDGEDTGIPATPAVDEQLDNIILQLQQHTTEIDKLQKQDVALKSNIDSNFETINNKVDSIKTATDNKIDAADANLQNQITSNDNDIATLNTKHESLSRTVQGIAATGGASTANNVTYNNSSSGLNAENAQDAIDELQSSKFDKTLILQKLGEAEDKVMSQKVTSTELNKKFDKNSIAQEPGDSEELVMSQKATTEIVRSIEMTANKLYDKKQNKYQDKINDIIFNGQDEYSYIDNISLVDLSNLAINKGYYITTNDTLVAYSGRNVSDYIDVSNYSGKLLVFWLADYFNDNGCTLCFYDTNKKLLYTDRNYPKGPITLSTDVNGNKKLSFVLLPGISYIRISFSGGNSIRLSVYDDKNETIKFTSLASITKNVDAVEILFNSRYKRLFYDDLIKNGTQFSNIDFYIHLNKGIYVRKIISYNELTYKFKIVRWDENLNKVIIVYSTTLTLESKDNNKYIYSLSDGGYFVNTDDCYFIPNNSNIVYSDAASYVKNKVVLYSSIKKGNEIIFGNIILSYDLLFLSPNEEEEHEKVEQDVNTIKVSSRFFKDKNYVAFGDSITDVGVGAEEAGLAYPNLVGRYFGFFTINLGSSGSTPHDHGTHMNLSDTNLAKITSDTMLVTISGGTNGWVTSDDINTLDRNTSIGAFNYAIDYIRRIAPKCIIILCPMYARSENFIKDYERIAENKGIGLAPILNNNLINWRDDDKDPSSPLYHVLLRDGIHPTNYGAFRMAALIKEYVRNFII